MNAESQNIEFKESWRDEYLKWICGFANAQGGIIYIGKNDQGVVVPLNNTKKLLEDIPNKVRDVLGILVDVNLRRSKTGNYLEIKVESYPYPVSYKGQYHYRSGSTKQELRGASLDKFLLERTGKRWDGVPMPGVSVSDLNVGTFDFFRNRALKSQRIEEEMLKEPNTFLLESLHLTEGKFLKRAAILLFHSKPERFITGAYIKIGYFESDTDLRYQDEIHGNIFEQIEKTMDLLFTKYIKSTISYDGFHRIETPEYPKDAIREALLNAITHKDYSGNTPIQISVYKDKLLIWNEGQLPDNWTVQKLTEKHASKPYNPDIANSVFRSGYIESWGRGTLKIIEKCIEVGLPAPTYSYDTSGLWVVFNKDVYTREYLETLDLNERQIQGMLYTKNKGRITNKEYQELNACARNTASNDLSDLVNRNLLTPSGQKGAGSFYRLV